MTKAENDIGDYEAATKLSDSYQDRHRAGDMTKDQGAALQGGEDRHPGAGGPGGAAQQGREERQPGGLHKKDGVLEEGYTYPLANPGLAEAPNIDYSTVVPRTGADRSATQPLIDTNHLYTQHQHEDEESSYNNKTRHNRAGAKIEAGTNTGDYLHGNTHQGNNRNKAMNNLGGDKTKDNGLHQVHPHAASNSHHGNNDSKADTSIDVTLQGDSDHGKNTNKGVTNHDDSHTNITRGKRCNSSKGRGKGHYGQGTGQGRQQEQVRVFNQKESPRPTPTSATPPTATPTTAITTPKPTPATATPSKATPAMARTRTRA